MSYPTAEQSLPPRARTDGFQGCSNKEICGERGFYLMTYGRDGLCDKCLHQKYPSELSVCAICNLATNDDKRPAAALCHACDCWLSELFTVENDETLLENFSWRQCNNLDHGFYMLRQSLTTRKIATTEPLAPVGAKAEGFYTPDLKRRVYFDKLDTSSMAIGDITWENRETIARRVLKEHGFVFTEYHIRHNLSI